MNSRSIHRKNFCTGTVCPFMLDGCEKFVNQETKKLAPFADQAVYQTGLLPGGTP